MYSELIDLPVATDERGSLCVAEDRHLPFPVHRVFWIYGVQAGKTRGGHAHDSCAEVVFPVSGSFDITLDDGTHRRTYHLDSPSRGVYIAPRVWCELLNFSVDAVCVVFASQAYLPDGYINDYDQFIAHVRP